VLFGFVCLAAASAFVDILGLYRKLVARQFDGSARRGPGRSRIQREVEQLIIRMASENRDWGYDRTAGALTNLGHDISDQTVGNVLRRHGLPPAPERKRTSDFGIDAPRLPHRRSGHLACSGRLRTYITAPSLFAFFVQQRDNAF
jgi:hypothetical protein